MLIFVLWCICVRLLNSKHIQQAECIKTNLLFHRFLYRASHFRCIILREFSTTILVPVCLRYLAELGSTATKDGDKSQNNYMLPSLKRVGFSDSASKTCIWQPGSSFSCRRTAAQTWEPVHFDHSYNLKTSSKIWPNSSYTSSSLNPLNYSVNHASFLPNILPVYLPVGSYLLVPLINLGNNSTQSTDLDSLKLR